MKLTRRMVIGGLAGGLVLNGPTLDGLAGLARAQGATVLSGPAFGSDWRLVLPDTADTAEAANARVVVESVTARVDRLMSPFRADSELARFNATGDLRLSSDTARVTESALDLARATGGAFDPTVAPMVSRYGFGPPGLDPRRPAGRHARLHLEDGRLRALDPNLTLDLCGSAKGFALDAIMGGLDGFDCLFQLGGEIGTRGRHPTGRAWRTGIEHPAGERLWRVLTVPDGWFLATSGNTRQGYDWGGRRYGHVVDPRTAEPPSNSVIQVSVMARSAMVADGLATAALVLGPEESREPLTRHDARALFLITKGGQVVERDVGGFLREQAS